MTATNMCSNFGGFNHSPMFKPVHILVYMILNVKDGQLVVVYKVTVVFPSFPGHANISGCF